jgi:hypothetical protein
MIFTGLTLLTSAFIALYPPILSEPPSPSSHALAQTSDDYSELRESLEASDWESANEETHRLILNQVEPDGDWEGTNLNEYEIKAESIDNISCDLLTNIDQLWIENSNGKYGFSTQAAIHWDADDPSYSDEAYRANERLFNMLQRVDWMRESAGNVSVPEPNYSNNAPTGHLPYAFLIWYGEGSLRSQTRRGQGSDALSSPFARKLAECSLSEAIPLTDNFSF